MSFEYFCNRLKQACNLVKIYKNINEFKKIKNAVVTTGTFDGVHVGHQVILNRLKKIAQNINGETVLLTFFPHPRMVLYPEDDELRLLNTIEERIQLIEKAGINHLIVHPFSKEFSRLSSVTFVRDILANKIGATKLVIGYDHHFGRNREGSFEHLKEYAPLYGFDVEEIPAQEVQQINISSTKIRNSLINGEINAATQFLGYHYNITGKVIKGKKVGREIGFPTANIKVKDWYKLIPKQGVYAVKVFIDGEKFSGMLNIGTRPTLNGNKQTIEVNVFNFNKIIYDKVIKIVFYERIRNEQNFNTLPLLKEQLIKDKIRVNTILDEV